MDGPSVRLVNYGWPRVRPPLFRFLHRLLTEHGNRAIEDKPSWKISRSVLESTMESYAREPEAMDRGPGTGGITPDRMPRCPELAAGSPSLLQASTQASKTRTCAHVSLLPTMNS